ncbi:MULTISPECIES: response regulator transcription factor [Methylosinus]|uniref:DNA-binding response regulator n=1 Tax=Methylosinus trichosporium (strain ATCC 35070 / NCIMB 11131 / UNIQEM 75 / OB3b) TaxID=595536 RepID=A0A2D2CXT7_METT3|nr:MULTISPECIES: response regulator transcription factor [Methylosinus]ATQ67557.1 DNA-binding response regulator [Methylosinus trichosporium OB3b]OBS50792.1 DNA-binding response regulator [Methylosinus sp. 3S-1]
MAEQHKAEAPPLANAPRVLIVDDEPQLLRVLKPALAAGGYRTIEAASGREALRAIAALSPDAVLLDLGLPDMDGKEVLAQARAFSQVPILIVSARDREQEKIEALDAGADDYVEKPFSIGELLARLRAALRHGARDAGPAAAEVESLGLRIDLANRAVTRDGAPVKLTPKEYDLLATLARHPGKLLTHKQILTAVWGPAHGGDTQYLRVFIGQLRAKIEEDPSAPRLIVTDPGVGYRFVKA